MSVAFKSIKTQNPVTIMQFCLWQGLEIFVLHENGKDFGLTSQQPCKTHLFVLAAYSVVLYSTAINVN
jgi:hypothetical protein